MHWQELCRNEEERATRALKNILLNSPATANPPTATASYSRRSQAVGEGSKSQVQDSPSTPHGAEDQDGDTDETFDIRTSSHSEIIGMGTKLKLYVNDIRTDTERALNNVQAQVSALNEYISGMTAEQQALPPGILSQTCRTVFEDVRVRLTQAMKIRSRAYATGEGIETAAQSMPQSTASKQDPFSRMSGSI